MSDIVETIVYENEYVAPILVVDSIIFQLDGDHLSVLLVKRAAEPFKDAWALPGGYCAAGETTHQAMDRMLSRKVGFASDDLQYVEQLYAFDTVARDPRGHSVSISYMGLGIGLTPPSGPGTWQPTFFPVNQLPAMAYDHADIIAYALKRLRSKLTYTNAVFGLLPPTFTLSELQAAYEAIFERPFDKRNFRKKYLSLDLIEETDQMQQKGAHRPARLYKFKSDRLQVLERSFD